MAREMTISVAGLTSIVILSRFAYSLLSLYLSTLGLFLWNRDLRGSQTYLGSFFLNDWFDINALVVIKVILETNCLALRWMSVLPLPLLFMPTKSEFYSYLVFFYINNECEPENDRILINSYK